MSAATTKVQNIVNENGVVVFSKSWCPFCKASKDLLSEFGATFRAVELDQNGTDDGADMQSALQEITAQRTVPNIFVGQKHMGGNSDLQAKKAELPDLLKAAGAL
ncbi:Glutaredoxin [Aspergillus sp. HF37]|nr:Glutaredoxin [Aspergillus sp. HF37]